MNLGRLALVGGLGLGGWVLASSADVGMPGWVLSGVGRIVSVFDDRAPSGPVADASLVFYASDAFDLELAQRLRQRPTRVHLLIQGEMTLDRIPEHLDRWLVAVAYTGGKVWRSASRGVEAFDGSGLGRLGEELTRLFLRTLMTALTYEPARHYNARLLYRPDTGRITHVIFEHRQNR